MPKRSWILGFTALGLACGGADGNDSRGGGADGGSLVTTLTAGNSGGGDTDDEGETDGASGGSGNSGNSGNSAGDDDIKFDIGGVPDVNLACGGGPGGGGGSGLGTDFSYIWVANSPEGTVSKINTQTLLEEGRYLVRADSAGSPSRTAPGNTG